jgi:hypothetical protein
MMTTTQPGNSASTSERAALSKAIAERDTAKEALRVASEAAERGKQLLRTAQHKLEQFGDVEGAILKHRAASFKSAAQGGPKPSLALPTDLLKRERARDEAASEVAAARAAHSSLVGEFAESQAALREAESKVSELAGQVLVAETAERGSALTAIWNDLWATVDSLKGLSSFGVQLAREVIRTLQSFEAMDHRQFAGNHNTQLARAVSYWKAYRHALCKSANATGPEHIDGDEPPAVERAA